MLNKKILLLLYWVTWISASEAQSGVYSPSPIVEDMLQQILIEQRDWNPENPALTIHALEEDAAGYCLKTSLEKEFGISVGETYWFNPLYGLWMLEKMDSLLATQGIRTNIEPYQDEILGVYEQTYQALAERQFTHLPSPDSALHSLALGYDLVFDTQTTQYSSCFFLDRLPPNVSNQHFNIPSTASSYLELLKAQSIILLQASEKGSSATRQLFYYALGGLLLGIILSVIYHQFFWKKKEINS